MFFFVFFTYSDTYAAKPNKPLTNYLFYTY